MATQAATSLIFQFEQFKDGDNYVCSRQEIDRILSNSKNVKVKKPQCSYFIWLNKHRKFIEKEYFSDFFGIEDWSIENKNNYYASKGLDTSKVVKEGRPRIASLITSKAGILWKKLDENEKKEYETISKKMKPVEGVKVENPPKEKKKRGRPRKNKEPTSVSDAKIEYCNKQEIVEESADDGEIQVQEIKHNGKTYWLDIKSFDIYDPETEEVVGKKNGENIYIN